MNCESCEQEIDPRCEYPPACNRAARWEAWFRGGGMVRRLSVCSLHVKESIGWKARESATAADAVGRC